MNTIGPGRVQCFMLDDNASPRYGEVGREGEGVRGGGGGLKL